MDRAEAKLRLIEAAARNPTPHPDGYPAGVQAAASAWFNWIFSEGAEKPTETLHLPPKKKP